ncbi:hypothetical protein V2G26_019922 [Clonostachys chloroleuca]
MLPMRRERDDLCCADHLSPLPGRGGDPGLQAADEGSGHGAVDGIGLGVQSRCHSVFSAWKTMKGWVARRIRSNRSSRDLISHLTLSRWIWPIVKDISIEGQGRGWAFGSLNAFRASK